MAKRERRKARSIERDCWIARSICDSEELLCGSENINSDRATTKWPKWIGKCRVRITEIVPKAKKASKRKGTKCRSK